MAKKDKEKMFIDENAIRKIADIMEEKNLSEIEIAEEKNKIRICKNLMTITPTAEAMITTDLTNDSSKETQPNSDLNTPRPSPKHVTNLNVVTSPMVGIVYMRPDPKSENFISIGDTVEKGGTLLLIEAMKVFNPIVAPITGKVINILVSDGTPVEYGEPLVEIDQ